MVKINENKCLSKLAMSQTEAESLMAKKKYGIKNIY